MPVASGVASGGMREVGRDETLEIGYEVVRRSGGRSSRNSLTATSLSWSGS